MCCKLRLTMLLLCSVSASAEDEQISIWWEPTAERIAGTILAENKINSILACTMHCHQTPACQVARLIPNASPGATCQALGDVDVGGDVEVPAERVDFVKVGVPLETCIEGFDEISDEFCLKALPDMLDYTEAVQQCRELNNSHVIVWRTKEEGEVIAPYMLDHGMSSDDAYLGCSDIEETGIFICLDGGILSPDDYWQPARPLDVAQRSPGDNCLLHQFGNRFHEGGCHRKLFVVCQYTG